MIVGLPREVKSDEYRVAMLPVGVEVLVDDGHTVLVETGAGAGTGLTDEEYAEAGATLTDAADVWKRAELVVKVKEPQPGEWPHMRAGQTLFTYFHFAADEALLDGCLDSGATCVAYETLRGREGDLPLLTPMSEVAGRMSIQQGAKFLERPQEGRGILLGGVPGVEPAHVCVLGAGVVGQNAAHIAAGCQASVSILDIDLPRLRHVGEIMPPNVITRFSDRAAIRDELARADLVVGGVLLPGAKAPKLVTREDLGRMKAGAVVVDVCIDQGGCFETSRPTTHADPTYVVDGVVHYCVANMPGAVPRTSTFALTNSTLPWARRLARLGAKDAILSDEGLASAANAVGGKLTCEPVAQAFGMEFVAPGVAAASI